MKRWYVTPKDDEVFEEMTVNGEEKFKMQVLEWYSAYSWEEEKNAFKNSFIYLKPPLDSELSSIWTC